MCACMTIVMLQVPCLINHEDDRGLLAQISVHAPRREVPLTVAIAAREMRDGRRNDHGGGKRRFAFLT